MLVRAPVIGICERIEKVSEPRYLEATIEATRRSRGSRLDTSSLHPHAPRDSTNLEANWVAHVWQRRADNCRTIGDVQPLPSRTERPPSFHFFDAARSKLVEQRQTGSSLKSGDGPGDDPHDWRHRLGRSEFAWAQMPNERRHVPGSGRPSGNGAY